MRLVDLEPRWLGERQGILFRCPTRPDNWLTVFFAPTPRKEQYKLWGAARPGSLDEDGYPNDTDVVFCKPEIGWRIVGGATFEDITIDPSLDASASGNWHGRITNGQIVGGICWPMLCRCVPRASPKALRMSPERPVAWLVDMNGRPWRPWGMSTILNAQAAGVAAASLSTRSVRRRPNSSGAATAMASCS